MIDLPDIRQKGEAGPQSACVTAVCNYWGLRVSLGYCTDTLLASGQDGTDPRTLEAFYRAHGLRVLAGDMDLETLQELTRRGRPVHCVWSGHYVVVRGVGKGIVAFHDPVEGKRRLPAVEFESLWSDTDRLGATYDRYGLAVWME